MSRVIPNLLQTENEETTGEGPTECQAVRGTVWMQKALKTRCFQKDNNFPRKLLNLLVG